MKQRRLYFGVLALGLLAFLALTVLRSRSLPLAVHTIHADDAMLRQVQALGATHVVQVFSWSDIQPSPARWDWEYTDWLVRATEHYNLKIIARLDKPPPWAVDEPTAVSAPPRKVSEYAEFARRVAERYRGKIAAYIIWNEPNLAIEWGNQKPNAAAYAELLRAASPQIRTADQNATILAAGLSPTNENSERAEDDRTYLRELYAAGVQGTFDALAIHPYGFANAPDVPRESNNGLNFSRLLDWREIMQANGDGQKPMWITEFGYPTEQPQALQDRVVDETDQANYLARAYEKTRGEFPFVEMFAVWNIVRDVPPTDEQFGYSLLRSDGSYKPAYASISRLAAQSPIPNLGSLSSTVRLPRPEFSVLARDAIVHLGDSELPAPFIPLYKGRNPSEEWKGEFYLPDVDLFGARQSQTWTVSVELMQVNDFDTRIQVNDVPLEPAFLPVEDFTSKWVTAQFMIPPNTLHSGYNTISILDGKLLPAFQQAGFTWDEFQFRNVQVIAP